MGIVGVSMALVVARSGEGGGQAPVPGGDGRPPAGRPGRRAGPGPIRPGRSTALRRRDGPRPGRLERRPGRPPAPTARAPCPGGSGAVDRRGFEWYYWRNRAVRAAGPSVDTHRGGQRRGVQPRRPARRLGRFRPEGQALGRPGGPGGPDPRRPHRPRQGGRLPAPTAGCWPRRDGTGRSGSGTWDRGKKSASSRAGGGDGRVAGLPPRRPMARLRRRPFGPPPSRVAHLAPLGRIDGPRRRDGPGRLRSDNDPVQRAGRRRGSRPPRSWAYPSTPTADGSPPPGSTRGSWSGTWSGAGPPG